MPLGYRDHADWRDLSDYVVHFTKDIHGGPSAYDAVMTILYEGRLRAFNRFGAARGLDALDDTQRCVCFSEIPLDMLDRLVERRGSEFGIGFHQQRLVTKGGGRVWYIDKDSPPAIAFDETMQASVTPWNGDAPIFELTPFVDFPGTYGEADYRFEWEREWRVPGDMTFTPDDVAFLFVPAELHKAAREFFAEAAEYNTGPAYDCPLLDPLWTDEQIQEALAQLP